MSFYFYILYIFIFSVYFSFILINENDFLIVLTKTQPYYIFFCSHINKHTSLLKLKLFLCLYSLSVLAHRVILVSLPIWIGLWIPSTWCPTQETMRSFTVSIFTVRTDFFFAFFQMLLIMFRTILAIQHRYFPSLLDHNHSYIHLINKSIISMAKNYQTQLHENTQY